MNPTKELFDELDPIKGYLRKLLTNNATEQYIADDSDTPSVMYLFEAKDLLYCFLSKQQRSIYNSLTLEFQTTNEISLKCGYATRDISSILGRLEKDHGLIEKLEVSQRRLKWRKAQ